MKCLSNRIGQWLDECHQKTINTQGSMYYRSYYDGAVETLKIAGFNVDTIPCGKSVIHIVKPKGEVV